MSETATLPETPTTQAPVPSSGLPTREDMLRLAAQEDADSNLFPSERPQPASVNPDAGGHAPAVDGDDAEAGDQEDGTPEAETQGETRQQKSAKRATKTWEEVNALKEEVKAMQADLLAMRSGDTPQAKIATLKQEAEQHLAKAKELKADGDEDGYKAALDAAELATTRAESLKRKQSTEALKATLAKQTEALLAEMPDLANPDTDMAKRHASLLKEVPALTTIENGMKVAARLAAAMGAEKRLAEVEKELAATKKLLQPDAGSAPAVSRRSGSEPKSRAEMRQALIAELRAQDLANGFQPVL